MQGNKGIEAHVDKIQHGFWEMLKDFLNFVIYENGDSEHKIMLTVRMVLLVTIVFVVTGYVLKYLRKFVLNKLSAEDKPKFSSVFSFIKYFIYIIVILFTFDNIGVNITAIFAASAALLVGVGLALQTFIQDILSGIFILMDHTITVGDIIEIEGKVGRVEEIKLRTTRAVTIDNKVLIIPNHKYLGSILYNWTQNGVLTRESISVGVAYGSDTALVKELLTQAALSCSQVVKTPEPTVFFTDFADSALSFKLVFTIDNSFMASTPKSAIRFEVDRLFREHQISIPFPQRDVHFMERLKV